MHIRSPRVLSIAQLTVINAAAFFCAQTSLAQAPRDVLTVNYDKYRTNANLQETILTPDRISPEKFGKLYTRSVDGHIFAQPLYLRSVEIPNAGVHNVLYVATMHNSVYAFDADSPSAGDALWHVNLGPSILTAQYPVTDITPEMGILSTPVIDPDTRTIYVVNLTMTSGAPAYYLHALDAATGKEKFNGPSLIQASVPGSGPASVNGMAVFDASLHMQRPGLLLSNGAVYIAFGSRADQGLYHGWMLSYRASDVTQQVSVFCTSPDGIGSSIWQGGRGPAVDDNGNIYVVTANGDYDGVTNFGESILQFDASGGLSMNNWFAPVDWANLNGEDADLGSAGPLLLPGSNQMLVGGKAAILYLINQDEMGDADPDHSGNRQQVPVGWYGLFSMALWNRDDGPFVYLRGYGETLKAFRLIDGQITSDPVAENPNNPPYSFDGLTLSANGGDPDSGILWLTSADRERQPANGVLHAYKASDITQEIWNSEMLPDRDRFGSFAKFASPTVVNGKVYVPTFSNQIAVYGLLPDAPVVTAVLNAGSAAAGPVAPGELLIVRGLGLGSDAPVTADTVTTALNGVRVLFDGTPGTLLYAGGSQINVVAPNVIAAKQQTEIAVEVNGRLLNPLTRPVAGVAPGFFTANGAGDGPLSAYNEDGTQNAPESPASRGEVVTFYVTGLPANPNLRQLTLQIDGTTAELLSVAQADGLPQGVWALRGRIPANANPSRAVVVSLRCGDAISQTNATIAVQ